MFSITSAYSSEVKTIPLEENVKNFAQNYFEISARKQFNREIFLTVSIIPPRDISLIPPCASAPNIKAFQGEDSALLKIDVSCKTGNKWNVLYLARAMYRPEPSAPLRAFSSKTAKQIASQPHAAGYLVKKGDVLELIARAEQIEIRSSVIAEENGRSGDVIWVKNKRSGKQLRAVVNSGQEVSPL
ncbi:flagellar basal body P-ring formation chaperone FlgA [Iodobacter fluviatilis]|uniref:Flagellar basal body P-ring biosynthesis protein FlgA n=2 Tax=Iodobacter fluviatilis TaxID=537 RepID=A0A377SVQ8_9NEIS|nr:flagellar basal body P-ring formation chaperone FlgA [Iodobacter fluviatilis]STR44569.1 flagellar basal body P-ring biosynthesis protein FlgA [Iodobacter fluviatilis]